MDLSKLVGPVGIPTETLDVSIDGFAKAVSYLRTEWPKCSSSFSDRRRIRSSLFRHNQIILSPEARRLGSKVERFSFEWHRVDVTRVIFSVIRLLQIKNHPIINK